MRGFYVLLAAAALLAGVGCGETVIDSAKTEDALQHNLETSLKKKVTAVECPSDQKVEPKATFTCKVELTGGKTEVATLKILNSDADVSVISLHGEASRANE
jgi:phage tail tube protein FII